MFYQSQPIHWTNKAALLTLLTSQGTTSSMLRISNSIGRHIAVWRSPLCILIRMFLEILANIGTTSGWLLVSSTLLTEYWEMYASGAVAAMVTNCSNLWKICVNEFLTAKTFPRF